MSFRASTSAACRPNDCTCAPVSPTCGRGCESNSSHCRGPLDPEDATPLTSGSAGRNTTICEHHVTLQKTIIKNEHKGRSRSRMPDGHVTYAALRLARQRLRRSHSWCHTHDSDEKDKCALNGLKTKCVLTVSGGFVIATATGLLLSR